MSKIINWGVIGLGGIAHKFVSDLLTLPDANLLVVSSTSAERAADFAAQYGAKHHTDSITDLLAINGLDVVYVAAEHVRHHAIVLQCLKASVAVLGEKPFAMNGQQVAEMVAVAREKKVFLMEALWSRFMPVIQQAKQWSDEGKIGTIRAIHADFGFKATYLPEKRLFNKKLGGGALLDIGIYPIFLSYLFLGMPKGIAAVANFADTGVDVSTTMSFSYENQATAALTCTLAAQTRCDGLIYGDAGEIHLSPRWHEATEVSLNTATEKTVSVFPRPSTHGYEFEAAHIHACLRAKLTESPLWSLTDSTNLMSLLDAVRAEIGLVY